MERILVQGGAGPRLRVRRVDELSAGRGAAELARSTGRPAFLVVHGGSVCNNYGYQANTEYAVARALPDGRVLVQVGRLPANKVTHGGCAGQVSEYLRVFYDDRYGQDTWNIAAYWAEREAREAIECSTFEQDALAQGHKVG